MQDRKPIYKDLLTHGISEEELDKFIQGLAYRKDDNSIEPVTKLTEINRPIYPGPYRNFCYHTGLCYATDINNIAIAKALLRIGAHPNIATNTIVKGSALILALFPRSPRPEILALFLKIPDLDIYISAVGRTAFTCTEGDSAMILRLLEADTLGVAELPIEEKTSMATTIASAITSFNTSYIKRANATNSAVYENVKKAYPTDNEKEVLHNTINEQCGFNRSMPQSVIILSYLFKPKSHSLKIMENLYEHHEAKAKIETKRSCSLM